MGLPPLFDELADEVAFLRVWQGRLAAAGFVGVTWPVEYGGRAADPLHHYIVQEELARARAPELVGRIGVNLVGPTVLAHGTPEQKARWLPGILSAEQLFCQLFSEPDAGSDLAAVSTRAVRVDGGWELHGQKVWTSYAQFADWGLCLARTDPDLPKRKGISAFMVDMGAPGVVIRPLRQITDESDFNEVFFDDVIRRRTISWWVRRTSGWAGVPVDPDPRARAPIRDSSSSIPSCSRSCCAWQTSGTWDGRPPLSPRTLPRHSWNSACSSFRIGDLCRGSSTDASWAPRQPRPSSTGAR